MSTVRKMPERNFGTNPYRLSVRIGGLCPKHRRTSTSLDRPWALILRSCLK